ncbi:hypothetical protein HMN09_00154000 [Mycena chlorophos]|uniref:Mid2 domain-containing protein n=1 Tax=Mycena chlorophos TaxID=658473 RepID=A0A8H6WMZ3_MYCCL|nr:hypothetical protein HMN09_00154000 [Mycena chlorophos]
MRNLSFLALSFFSSLLSTHAYQLTLPAASMSVAAGESLPVRFVLEATDPAPKGPPTPVSFYLGRANVSSSFTMLENNIKPLGVGVLTQVDLSIPANLTPAAAERWRIYVAPVGVEANKTTASAQTNEFAVVQGGANVSSSTFSDSVPVIGTSSATFGATPSPSPTHVDANASGSVSSASPSKSGVIDGQLLAIAIGSAVGVSIPLTALGIWLLCCLRRRSRVAAAKDPESQSGGRGEKRVEDYVIQPPSERRRFRPWRWLFPGSRSSPSTATIVDLNEADPALMREKSRSIGPPRSVRLSDISITTVPTVRTRATSGVPSTRISRSTTVLSSKTSRSAGTGTGGSASRAAMMQALADMQRRNDALKPKIDEAEEERTSNGSERNV